MYLLKIKVRQNTWKGCNMPLSKGWLPLPDTPLIPIIYLIMRAQIYWVDHIIHMLDKYILKQLLLGELSAGKYLHGGQKKCFQDLEAA